MADFFKVLMDGENQLSWTEGKESSEGTKSKSQVGGQLNLGSFEGRHLHRVHVFSRTPSG
jgi:hypothetical protein